MRHLCDSEHPRVRGENSIKSCVTSVTLGTSPRARGKRILHLFNLTPSRNIPACAGKTTSSGNPHPGDSEHPRVRGENWWQPTDDGGEVGTSPRARGKHDYDVAAIAEERNIPACAGKTGFPSIPKGLNQEHPRVRGENTSTPNLRKSQRGTSPRARGKLTRICHCDAPGRNIPACAGKTGDALQVEIAGGEHPRVRGENAWLAEEEKLIAGTSPRARGKLLVWLLTS